MLSDVCFSILLLNHDSHLHVQKLEFLIEKSNTPLQAADAKSDLIHFEDAGASQQ